MPDITTIADVPTLTLDAGELPTGRIVVARLGQYKDKRYGAFGITEQHLASWQRNLTEHFDGRVAIDFDHSPEKGKGSKAAGWITSLERKSGAELKAEDPARFSKLDDAAIYAASDVEFSKAGADAIRNREYAYISPTFPEKWTDETGVDRGSALIGAGFTNRPFLRRGMPAISLSADDFITLAEATPEPSDSRGRMPLSDIAKKLGLAEDADEAKILAFLPDSAAGVKVLTAEEYAGLLTRAAAGDAATTTLAETRFKTAWDKAISETRVTPAQEAGFKALSDVNLDIAVKTLDELPKIALNTESKGHGLGGEEPIAPDGVDQDRYALDQEVEAYMLEHKMDDSDYAKALHAVVAAKERAA